MADESRLPEHPEPPPIRISDADRHAVAERLRDAAAEGRLEMDELDERLEAAFGARYAADLVPLVSDLPQLESSRATSPARVNSAAQGTRASIAVMGGSDRLARWTIAEEHTALAVMGGVDLDLREVTFTAPETTINAVAIMGGIDITVGPHTRVKVEGIGLMGSFGEERGKGDVESSAAPDAPLVRIRGLALMGGVGVRRKPLRKPKPTQITQGD